MLTICSLQSFIGQKFTVSLVVSVGLWLGQITTWGTGCCTFTVSLVVSVGVWLGQITTWGTGCCTFTVSLVVSVGLWLGQITTWGTGCCTFTVSLVVSVGVWLGADYYLGYWVLYIHCMSGPVCRCVVRGRLLPGVLGAVHSLYLWSCL